MRTAGSTNNSEYYRIVGDNSHATPGEPITGLLYSDIETGGSASYNRQGAARVDLTLITLASASAAHADGGFILVDDTNQPGVYRCDYPDAAYVTGVQQVNFSLVVAAANNAIAIPIAHDLIDFDMSTAAPTVDLVSLAGVVQSLTDLKAFADSGFDPGTNKINGVVTVDVTTTNTDMRGTDSAALATALTTAQNDLDIITGATGVNLLTATQASIDAVELDTGTTIPATITTAQADLDIITGASGVNLLTATQASIDAIELDTGTTLPATLSTLTTNVATVDTVVDGIQTDLSNTTDGLGALKILIDALNDASAASVFTTQMTESYNADGTAPTPAQALFMILSRLTEFSISGTTITMKKLDGSTSAATLTMDSSTAPTSSTRAT